MEEKDSKKQVLSEEELEKVSGGEYIEGKGSNSGQGHKFGE